MVLVLYGILIKLRRKLMNQSTVSGYLSLALMVLFVSSVQNAEAAPPPAEIISFRASPSPVETGKDVRFYWEVKGAGIVRLYDSYGEIEGRIQLDNGTYGWPLKMTGAFMTPQTKTETYRLVVVNREGKKTVKTLTVQVKNEMVPLKSYWSSKRGDNVLCGTKQCIQAQSGSNVYRYLRVEGCAFKTQVQGTIPLVLYWNPTREDNVSVASNASRQAQEKTGGYRKVRTEAYVYKQKQSGTIPLKLFWYPKRTDNATVAATESVAAQNNTAGMSYVRTEGYVYPASSCR
jgi:hypothetical protein